jgi:hypothetical protein
MTMSRTEGRLEPRCANIGLVSDRTLGRLESVFIVITGAGVVTLDAVDNALNWK